MRVMARHGAMPHPVGSGAAKRRELGQIQKTTNGVERSREWSIHRPYFFGDSQSKRRHKVLWLGMAYRKACRAFPVNDHKHHTFGMRCFCEHETGAVGCRYAGALGVVQNTIGEPLKHRRIHFQLGRKGHGDLRQLVHAAT